MNVRERLLLPDCPLFNAFKKAKDFEILQRPFDARWKYSGIVPRFQHGFNPFGGKGYYSQKSELAFWLESGEMPPSETLRRVIANETLMLVHDYLHYWAVQETAAFFTRELGRELASANLQVMDLVLILSEAVATVGLDYWVLTPMAFGRTYGLSQDCHQVTINLTPEQIAEIRTVKPDFNVFEESFFTEIAEFYFSGEMTGFDLEDMNRSEALRSYVVHEITYGETQRAYARIFTSQIWNGTSEKLLDYSPMTLSESWQVDLMGYLGRRLWKWVRGEEAPVGQRKVIDLPQFKPLLRNREKTSARLICAEKFHDLSSSEFIYEYDDAVDVYLSNLDITSLDPSDIEKLLARHLGGGVEYSLEWMRKELPSFARARHLKAPCDVVYDDFIFCLP